MIEVLGKLGTCFAGASTMYYYVYLLQSADFPERHYVGLTRNLEKRLDDHNQGRVQSTVRHCPWEIDVAVAFRDETKAAAFEQYLKSHSGRAFSKRHF